MGLNDPQWGRKKGNSGPPDLDQLWRNFNKKLTKLEQDCLLALIDDVQRGTGHEQQHNENAQ